LQEERKNHYKNLLEDKKRHLEFDIKIMDKNDTAQMNNESSTELSNYDNHPADLGEELFLTELNYALKNHQKNQISEVNQALHRIENGNYGICSDCGKEIPEERLEAMPTARFCIDCQNDNAFSKQALGKDRPIEEKVIGIPFIKKTGYLHREYVVDGINELYDVMKYGSSSTPQDMGGYDDYEEYYTNEIDRQGIVDPIDAISNEQYKRQLP